MVTFSKKIPVKYQELDYSGVIQNYHWIQNSLLSEFKDVEIPNIEISFKMGDISCSCESIEEFSTHAYEQSIDVYMYNMHFYKKNNNDSHTKIASIILSFSNKVFNISCDSKEILIKICTALENSMKQDVSNVLLQNKDIKYIHDESIHVEIGDNNTIQSANVGKNNSIKTESLTPKESFWSHVFQTLVANWLWFIFGLALIVLTGYFGLKNLDWMNVF